MTGSTPALIGEFGPLLPVASVSLEPSESAGAVVEGLRRVPASVAGVVAPGLTGAVGPGVVAASPAGAAAERVAGVVPSIGLARDGPGPVCPGRVVPSPAAVVPGAREPASVVRGARVPLPGVPGCAVVEAGRATVPSLGVAVAPVPVPLRTSPVVAVTARPSTVFVPGVAGPAGRTASVVARPACVPSAVLASRGVAGNVVAPSGLMTPGVVPPLRSPPWPAGA